MATASSTSGRFGRNARRIAIVIVVAAAAYGGAYLAASGRICVCAQGQANPGKKLTVSLDDQVVLSNVPACAKIVVPRASTLFLSSNGQRVELDYLSASSMGNALVDLTGPIARYTFESSMLSGLTCGK